MSRTADAVIVGAFAIAALVLGGLIVAWPGSGRGVVAVVYPPWTDARRAATRATEAGAALVAFGRFPFIVLVRPRQDGYRHRALEDGAILILDAGDRRGCATSAAASTVTRL